MWRVAAAALTWLAIGTGPVRAQNLADSYRARSDGREQQVSTWAGEVTLLGINTALGALNAGLLQELRGGSFWAGVRDGAMGGATTYAGKRVVVQSFPGAGLLGREVAAVGASMVRNASEGRPALGRIVLPIGPVRLDLRTDSTSRRWMRPRIRLDIATLLAAGYVILQEGVAFVPGQSLSSGMPVFSLHGRSPEEDWAGYQVAGVIWQRGDPSAAREAGLSSFTVLAHERVHVLQYDFGFLIWSDPVEERLTRELPGGTWMDRHLDWGLFLAGWGLANQVIPYHLRPWEQEAHFLGRVPARER